ncbi:MAG: class IV adenylate cyclase [Sarcina sp.]
MQEFETRVMDIDIEEIRKICTKAGAENVKKENQVNDIYDFADRRLLDKKGYARIRTVEDKINNKTVYFMTTKKMLSQDKFKVMEENETIIEDGEMGARIFKSLGLELQESIKKYRESYKYKNSLIEIDINDENFCPFPYIEIETTSEDELNEVLEMLGYTDADTTSKTIYQILEERGFKPNAKGKGL